jgi:hypothetical protein
MLGLEMLDVAIGMTFIYLLLSLVCTALNELIEGWLKLRAVDLEQGIRELLKDPKNAGDPEGKLLAQQLYNHPLIYSLFRGEYDPAKIRKNDRYSRGDVLPSYIPAANFALALLDVVQPPAPGATPTRVQAAVQVLVKAAGGDLNKTRENIEGWFNTGMDRVSGWYKRRVQRIVLFLGLGLAVFTNADSIAIFKSLTDNPAMRSAVVAAAGKIQADSVGQLETSIDSNLAQLNRLGLPIGWDWKSCIYNSKEAVSNFRAIPPFTKENVFNWVLKVVGWCGTAIAISLGAPFWFDVLNKFMVVRATVKPHEKSLEEDSEDRQIKPSVVKK